MNKIVKACFILLLPCYAGVSFAAPISDTVVVDGTEWAQVDLFTDVTWSELNAVCPAGRCGAGSINGHSLAGWQWASLEDVNALFNYYLRGAGTAEANLLGPGPGGFSERGATWDNDFMAAGWRTTYTVSPPYSVWGITSDEPLANPSQVYQASIIGDFYYPKFNIDIHAQVATGNDPDKHPPPDLSFARGAWLYKAQSADVPLPSTLLLMLSGTVLLSGFNRRDSARHS